MIHSGVHKNGHVWGCCGPMTAHQARPCGMGFGIMLVIIGAIWLAAELGWINTDLFWPSVVLAAGIAVLAISFAGMRKTMIHDRPDKEV